MHSQRILVLLLASAALGGCARFDQRSYGSWLDTYGMPAPGQRQAVAEPEATQLRAQIAQLQAQGEAIRVKLASEPDRVKRYALMRELRDIGDKERPLDDRLHLGPTPTTEPIPEPGPAGG